MASNIMRNVKDRITRFVREKLIAPSAELTMVEVMVAVVAGTIAGIFPIPMLATVVTLAYCRFIMCSAPQTILGTAVNAILTPIQFILIPVFARFAAYVAGYNSSNFTTAALQTAIEGGVATLVGSCLSMLLFALVAWLMICIPVTLFLRRVQRTVSRQKTGQLLETVDESSD